MIVVMRRIIDGYGGGGGGDGDDDYCYYFSLLLIQTSGFIYTVWWECTWSCPWDCWWPLLPWAWKSTGTKKAKKRCSACASQGETAARQPVGNSGYFPGLMEYRKVFSMGLGTGVRQS